MSKIFLHKKLLIWVSLVFILMIAAGLRVYKLGEVPPPLNWDEAANGYNAFTIANWGRDEYGKTFPAYFKSFGDDKRPLHIYITAFFVKFLDLSEFSTRLPAAVFGLLDVGIIFLLGKYLLNSSAVGLIGAVFLAISPYALQYSRFNQELVFTLFFFMLGIFLFLIGLQRKNWLLSFSFLALCISLFGYQSALVVVPPMMVLLTALYIKDLLKLKKYFLTGMAFLVVTILIFISNPALFGGARMKQTGFYTMEVTDTAMYGLTKNKFLGRVNKTIDQYLTHFSWQYLFVSGDRNERLSTQAVGEFYKIDALFLIIGAFALLWKRSKGSIILLSWALLAPLPASAVGEVPHASRAMFMFGSLHLVSAYGLYTLLNLVRVNLLKKVIIVVTTITLIYSLTGYLKYYYEQYSNKSATEWQYGMKDIVSYVKDHPEYTQVYMVEERHQPYIFFAYFLKIPLPDYLSTAIYNRSETKDFSTVSYFDRYYFGGWDPIESIPEKNVLYVVTPSQYGGLRHRLEFDMKKLVKYPNGADAFFLVSI